MFKASCLILHTDCYNSLGTIRLHLYKTIMNVIGNAFLIILLKFFFSFNIIKYIMKIYILYMTRFLACTYRHITFKRSVSHISNAIILTKNWDSTFFGTFVKKINK